MQAILTPRIPLAGSFSWGRERVNSYHAVLRQNHDKDWDIHSNQGQGHRQPDRERQDCGTEISMQPLTRQNHITSKVPLNLGVEDQSGRSLRGGDLYSSDAAL
jgi:hypothetical protein